MSDAFPRAAVHRALADGLRSLDAAGAAPVDALVDYLALLHRWNRAFNLSAVREPLAMVPRHVLDSLSALPYVEGAHLLDVGTGAGLPGIPLALGRPDLHVVLLDSNGKKTRFLRQAAADLPLANVEVVHDRLERWPTDRRFDTVIARALTRLDGLVRDSGRLLASGGQILAMKGRFDPGAETGELETGWTYRVHPLRVHGLDAERCLVRVRRTGEISTGETHG
ncbi:16S rRNA (guanine(527)-N(7))-methyltransferase RsmG [Aquisalimonas lutea]|uniref:16S rRNA (guanine(527)-N(7))-methyltransferase RsmG n=1 Tax=Aquisalimonas lutea TaxID=1327750 RepID=UPI0025B336E6|nr:16S rRNA (guanine(527)-N(7))-methyltransferase RsmG [Aquisalimonas lutea]MDN3516611.1 16S rRNA (guanine(527)-N(7))-methyltransferase RsmG [Aquisalimonas lutea]